MAAACVATTALFLAGCGTAHQSGHAGSQSHAGSQGHLTASRAIALAARSAAKVTSLTLVENMTMHGIPVPGAGGLIPGTGGGAGAPANGSLAIHATASMRLKPALLAAIAMNMHFGGRSVQVAEILTSRAIYMKIPGMLPTQAGKPWAKISLASLPNGTSLRKLFEQAQKGNPLTAMGNPSGLAKFLAAAKHLRVVRDQSVDGVPATEYSGIINLRALAPSMSATERQIFGSLGPASIRFWIDHQHQMRKMDLRFALGKASIVMAVHVTSINKPVRIVPPPASQVSVISHP